MVVFDDVREVSSDVPVKDEQGWTGVLTVNEVD
jgi:hypothetical protein